MDKIKQKAMESKERLLEIIKPSDTLTVVIKSVSRSGMTRRMRVLHKERDITYLIASLCEMSCNDTGILVSGCGMDMTFWLAENITGCLYGLERPKELRGNGGGTRGCLNWTAV